jgi:hypothetical protein
MLRAENPLEWLDESHDKLLARDKMIAPAVRGNSTRKAVVIALATYAVVLAAIVGCTLKIRQTILRDFDTPEARAEWQAWRDAEPNQPDRGPVRRKPPSTAEPPALLLMRDHFAVVMSGAILFGSFLFVAIATAARGALARNDSPAK